MAPMDMMTKRGNWKTALVSLFAAAGCATQPNVDDLISGPVVVTKFDPTVDFSTFDTFAVNPTVSLVRDDADGGVLRMDASSAIVDRIIANVSGRGYRLVGASERPSLGFQATVYIQRNLATAAYAGYWWGLPGYAGAPAYWGYPGGAYYTPWTYVTQAYKSGTLIVECVNLRDAQSGSPRLEVVWAAYAHAVTQKLLESLSEDALAAIDQAFLQSPYLQSGEPGSP
jgi:Domain of unknown function (DUF4136)